MPANNQTRLCINCDTSAAIFGNIFFNKAPLHDGACIVRDGKIFAAGCILPLNSKEDGRRDIGTRHRAAIGVSEVSDAMVLVVSEETGQISIARNGILKRNFDRDQLVETLEEYLIPAEPEKTERTPFFKKRKENKTDEE